MKTAPKSICACHSSKPPIRESSSSSPTGLMRNATSTTICRNLCARHFFAVDFWEEIWIENCRIKGDGGVCVHCVSQVAGRRRWGVGDGWWVTDDGRRKKVGSDVQMVKDEERREGEKWKIVFNLGVKRVNRRVGSRYINKTQQCSSAGRD